jgi:hypothetical protein
MSADAHCVQSIGNIQESPRGAESEGRKKVVKSSLFPCNSSVGPSRTTHSIDADPTLALP